MSEQAGEKPDAELSPSLDVETKALLERLNRHSVALRPEEIDHAAEVADMKPTARQEYYTQCTIKELRTAISDWKQEALEAKAELKELRAVKTAYEKLKYASKTYRIVTGISALLMGVGGVLIGQFQSANTGWWFLSSAQLVGLGWCLILFPGLVHLLMSIFHD